MRILAALTLLISVWISPHLPASQPQLEWEYEVNPNLFLRNSTLLGWVGSFSPVLGQGGVCGMAVEIQSAEGEQYYAIAVLNSEGQLIWKSPALRLAPRPVLLNKELLVYRYSTLDQGADPSSYFSVALSNEAVDEVPRALAFRGRFVSSYWDMRASDRAFLAYNNTLNRAVVQKWSASVSAPTLAPSTFGLEDGNLIISWPTAAGHTYQVQRSTDLEFWENIGVALTGNGTTMSYSQPSNADKVFLRVVVP